MAGSVAAQEKGAEAAEGRWRDAVASELIAKERSSIIRIRGQWGPGDQEERLGSGLGAGHGSDGPECEHRVHGRVLRTH
ncbi:hypothetical protein NDU88_006233 [Pleurodeles waltl]|uniref:Uncharacterized protein n=1 Tax=Pleurodeles waltl TaxID=8319 RepID=A0AAV7RMH2_PLEWA|nr:hypothetical protein NDU88_006233 [Pleurodeles waltl]